MRLCCALLASVVALSACAKRPARVKIGIALTRSNHPAVELAIREIAGAGGVRGVTVEAVGLGWNVHEAFAPAEIVGWCKRFADSEDVVAVIGPSDSASTLSAAGLLNQRGVPQLVTIATNAAITNIGPFTYRLCVSDKVQASALADYAVRRWGKKRISVFHADDDYGWGLAHHFEEDATRLGAEIVSSTTHRNLLLAEDEALIATVVRRLAASPSPPDLVVLFQRMLAGELTVAALRAAGLKADILCGDNLAQPAFAASRPELKEGIRASALYDPAPEEIRARAFVARYRKAYGTDPDYGQAFAYDAVGMVRDALNAEGFSRAAVKRYLDRLVLSGTSVRGVGGAFTIGADHDARRPIFLVELTAGRQKVLQALPTR